MKTRPKMKMTTEIPPGIRTAKAILSMAVLALMLGLGGRSPEREPMRQTPRSLFKAMSDYLAAQKAISFRYDTILEVVTNDKQKLALASSGTVTLNRPDKIRATRTGGFADVELLFDGKTLTLARQEREPLCPGRSARHDRPSGRRVAGQIRQARSRRRSAAVECL